jgi:WD40 repeat protein
VTTAEGPEGFAPYARASDQARVYPAGRDQYVLEVRDLRATFVMAEGRLHRVGRTAAEDACPYPGLEPFGLDQADWYFGRDAVVADLVVRLDRSVAARAPLVVVAPSGAGKTSLLRAGLLPAIGRGDLPAAGSRYWRRLVFTPTASPMRALASQFAVLTGEPAVAPPDWRAADHRVRRSALRRALGRTGLRPPDPRTSSLADAGDSRRVVVVVDQLEEVFTQCEDEAERRAFVDELAWLADPRDGQSPLALVVLGLRADFYAQCAAYPWLRCAVQRNQVFVGPMSVAELRDAVVLPAQRAGLMVETGLPEVLLRDLGAVGGESGGRDGTGERPGDYEAGRLPLLAHALRTTWMQRDNGVLTVRGYQATRGIEHAVTETAERAFAGLGPAAAYEQPGGSYEDAARSVFLRLVAVTEGTEPSRRRVPRDDLLRFAADPKAARIVLDTFTAARLLTQSRETVAITHEVLLRAWPRLKGWLDDDRIGSVVRQELREAAFAWERAGRPGDLLYPASRLEAVQGATAVRTTVPGDDRTTRAFLAASTARVKRAARLRRTVTAVLLALALLASGAATLAYQQRGKALDERNTAIFSQVSAEADRLRTTDSSLAAQLDLVAYRMRSDKTLYTHLLTDAEEPLSAPLASGIGGVVAVAVSPDGRTMAAGSSSNAIQLWNIADTTHPVKLGPPIKVYADITESLAFSPDGRTLAAGGNDATLRLWDVTSPAHPVRLGKPLRAHSNTVGAVAFSPDGHVLASGSADKTIQLWNVADPVNPVSLGKPLTGHTSTVASLAFSPDGRTLASGGFDYSVRLWKVADPAHAAALGKPLYGHGQAFVESVAFSPDGRTLASGGADGRARLWNTTDLAHVVMLGQLLGQTGNITSVVFSRSGQTLATASYDGSIDLWDVVAPGDPVARGNHLVGHTGAVLGVAFTPDGGALVSGGADSTVRVWTFPKRLLTSYSRSLDSVVFSPDGRTMATAGTDGKVRLWDVSDPDRTTALGMVQSVAAPASVRSLAFSADGKVLAGGSFTDGAVELWDTSNPARPTLLPRKLNTFMGHVSSVAFSPSGRTLAVGGMDSRVELWDLTDAEDPALLTQPLTGPGNGVTKVAFSPDGRTLASANGDKTVWLWDVRDPARAKPLGKPLTGHTGLVLSVAFSPDGRTLASSSYDSTVRLWDVRDPARAKPLGKPLTGHGTPVGTLAYSPDGRTLASGGTNDGTVRLWDVTYPAHAHAVGGPLTATYLSVASLAFDRGGRLASAGADGVIRLWDLNAEHAARWICSTTRKALTVQQWKKYVPQLPYDPPCA